MAASLSLWIAIIAIVSSLVAYQSAKIERVDKQ